MPVSFPIYKMMTKGTGHEDSGLLCSKYRNLVFYIWNKKERVLFANKKVTHIKTARYSNKYKNCLQTDVIIQIINRMKYGGENKIRCSPAGNCIWCEILKQLTFTGFPRKIGIRRNG